MEFTLYYRGPLKSNGSSKDKHKLRQYFHPQLKMLWKQMPLSHHRFWLQYPPKKNERSVIKPLRGFNFAPLICEELALVAKLNITLLRPEPPGSIISQGGDIDNRLKTLFDALKVPTEINAIPNDTVPSGDENPFFCLFEDDKLITGISVQTDRFLEPTVDKSEIILLLHVKVGATMLTIDNSALLG